MYTLVYRPYGDNIVVCSAVSNVSCAQRQQCALERISPAVSVEKPAFNDRVFRKLMNGIFELVAVPGFMAARSIPIKLFVETLALDLNELCIPSGERASMFDHPSAFLSSSQLLFRSRNHHGNSQLVFANKVIESRPLSITS